QFRIAAGRQLRRLEPKEKFLDAVQCGTRFLQSFEGEVQLLPVADGNKKIPDRERIVAFLEKIAQREEVPFRFCHLFAIHEQMFAVYPEPDEWPAGDGLALRYLVFMVWKQKIDAAAVQIECFAEIPHRHCGTFQMPAGTAFPERRRPSRLA